MNENDNPSIQFLVPLPNTFQPRDLEFQYEYPFHYYIDECSSECDTIVSGDEYENSSSRALDLISEPFNNPCSELFKTNIFKQSNNRLWKQKQPTSGEDIDEFSDCNSEIYEAVERILSTNLEKPRSRPVPKNSRSSVFNHFTMKRKVDSIDPNDSGVFSENNKKRRKLERSEQQNEVLSSDASDLDSVFISNKKQHTHRDNKRDSKHKSQNNCANYANSDTSDDKGNELNEILTGTQEIDFGNSVANRNTSTSRVQTHSSVSSSSEDESASQSILKKPLKSVNMDTRCSSSKRPTSDESLNKNNSVKYSRRESAHSLSNSDEDSDNRSVHDSSRRSSVSSSDTVVDQRNDKTLDRSRQIVDMNVTAENDNSVNKSISMIRTPKFMSALKSKHTSTPLLNNDACNDSFVSDNTNVEPTKQNHGSNKPQASQSTRRSIPKLVPAISNVQFDQDLLFTEDLSDNDEIWVAQCPKSLKMESLLGVKFDLDGKSSFSATTKKGKTVSFEAFASLLNVDDEAQNNVYCLAPSRNQRNLTFKTVEPRGTISIQESITTDIEPCTIKIPTAPKLPDNLKVNHPLLGVDYKERLTEVENLSKSCLETSGNREKRKHSRSSFTNNGSNLNDGIDIENRVKVKEHKDKRREQKINHNLSGDRSVDCESTNASESDLQEYMKKKKQKKKHKRKANEYEIEKGEENVQQCSDENTYINNSTTNLPSDEILPSKKHKKHKNKRHKNEETYADEECTSLTNNEETFAVNVSNANDLSSSKKHKKKKKKDKYNDNFTNGIDELQSHSINNNEEIFAVNVSNSNDVSSSKKHKKKKDKHKSKDYFTNRIDEIETHSITNNEEMFAVNVSNANDLSSSKKNKKKKKKKDKDNDNFTNETDELESHTFCNKLTYDCDEIYNNNELEETKKKKKKKKKKNDI